MVLISLFFIMVVVAGIVVAAGLFIELVGAIFGLLAPLLELIVGILCIPYWFFEALFGGDNRRRGSYEPTPAPEPAREQSRYTADWASVSRRYKKSRNWTCEACEVYCGGHETHKTLLHVHHLDLDPQNNSLWNLVAVCVQCHGSMEGVGHKRLASASKTDGRWGAIDYLRRRQGL